MCFLLRNESTYRSFVIFCWGGWGGSLSTSATPPPGQSESISHLSQESPPEQTSSTPKNAGGSLYYSFGFLKEGIIERVGISQKIGDIFWYPIFLGG